MYWVLCKGSTLLCRIFLETCGLGLILVQESFTFIIFSLEQTKHEYESR